MFIQYHPMETCIFDKPQLGQPYIATEQPRLLRSQIATSGEGAVRPFAVSDLARGDCPTYSFLTALSVRFGQYFLR